MDLAEFRHMTFHAGPVRSAGRLLLYTIIPISPVSDDNIELRPPYLTSIPMIMSHTGIKTARTVNKHLDALVAAGWLRIDRPKDGTLVVTPAVPETCVCDCQDDETMVTRA
jgi:hypothetical protein